ncbi:MAG: hypothetical protein LBQ51_00830 [Desulfovibrio sp.]|jgi:hypothetical protein|nr:hypothetical protein [Desulfovibrio sp.]
MNEAARILEDRLESYALDEEEAAAAYESVGAQARAALKKCIARLYRIYGELDASRSVTRRFRDGFTLETHEVPAAFALIICSAAYPCPASLPAATLPALLAGVPLFPCFLPDREKSFPALSAVALELAGAGSARIVPENVLLNILRELADPRAGRLILLGPPAPAPALAAYAHAGAVPCLSLAPPLPRLRPEEENRSGTNRPATGGEVLPFLELDAAHEDLRILPNLEPAWFRSRGLKIYSS